MRSPRGQTTIAVLAVSLLVAAAFAPKTLAATPSSGALSPTTPALTYTSGPFYVPNQTGTATGTPLCNAGAPCDDYTLNVAVPSGYNAGNNVSVNIAWPNPTADFDLYVLDSSGAVVASSATSNDPEVASFPAASGTYTVRVVPYTPLGQSITGTVSLASTSPSTPPSGAPPAAQGTGIAPRYQTYAAPAPLGTTAGEPSIGADWKTGDTLIESDLQTLRVSFNDFTSPAQATWVDKSAPTSVTSLDPILFTDHVTNRTFVSQLAGTTSLSSFSDDAGEHWTPSTGGGLDSGVDHQTIGGDPFHAPLDALNATAPYTHAVYYCSQDIADATCALSVNGGQTYNPAVPIYTINDCGGLHGHVKVAPNDGTVYVPNKSCGGTALAHTNQGLAVSTNNGTTWQVRTVPDSTPGEDDPSIGIDAQGTLYFGYHNGDGHADIAVSHDQGQTWTKSVDVGAAFGIKNMSFPEVVAGDDDRASFAFLGTTTAGDDQAATFAGTWHLYIASTFDGGKTWTTVDTTPSDPVQRGCIWHGGGSNPCRNLLDFNDITVDQQGRVLVGYADGCVGPCASPTATQNSYSAVATIARQSGGRRLFHQYDPTEPVAPSRSLLTATQYSNESPSIVHLTWTAPDNGGSAITRYNIYRGTDLGAETYLGTSGVKTAYLDKTAKPGPTYYYQVQAVNAVGAGPRSPEVTPSLVTVQNPCALPGVQVLTDPAGDQVGAPANADLDIQAINVTQVTGFGGAPSLLFTLKVGDLSTLLPKRQWRILFNNGTNGYYVGMSTDAEGTPSYEYGSLGSLAGEVSNVPTKLGDADAGSSYAAADGTISIVIAASKIGNPQAGQYLTSINGRTFAGTGTALFTQDTAIDYTSPGSFTLGSCPSK